MSMLLAESLTFSDLSSIFVGLPDKIDIRLSSRLQMPGNNHPIPLRATDLGAYATPNFNTLKSLSKLLIYIIFSASKA